jgi:hypothetical protein
MLRAALLVALLFPLGCRGPALDSSSQTEVNRVGRGGALVDLAPGPVDLGCGGPHDADFDGGYPEDFGEPLDGGYPVDLAPWPLDGGPWPNDFGRVDLAY